MAEYIEREALENELYRQLKFLIAEYGEHDQYTSGFDDAMDKVEKFPAADVVPVVHGRWGEYETFPLTQSLNGYPCSKCGTHFSSSQIVFMNYCPNCGAKMDGEEQDDELIL